jgi:PAS domain S-box-containing protein
MARNTVPLTGVERTFDDSAFIVSMTDVKGNLIYCNDVFIKLAGYKENELLGKQHNIVRHPDMPRCVFKLLWDTISSGEEILAYVVNKSKNGDHYWVFAHMTPTFDGTGKLIGYFSSRRNVSKKILAVIEPLYQSLREEEARHSSKKEGMQAGCDMLIEILKEKNVSYSEFVLGLWESESVS